MSQQFPSPGLPPREGADRQEANSEGGQDSPPAAPASPGHGYEVLPSDFQNRTPWVSYTILVITILVYLVQFSTDFYLGVDLPAVYGMKMNDRILQGEWWRLFTPMLLHGGLLHIGFNMYAMYIIGPDLERHFGHTRFFMLYVLSGFAGNVISMALTDANSLGASTAIFGLFGAQGVFIYQNRQLFGQRAQIALRRIINLGIINLVIGLSPGIDNWGHIGGLLGGVAFAWYAGPILIWEGLTPPYRLVDRRESGRVGIAAIGIGLLFAVLAAWLIIFRIL